MHSRIALKLFSLGLRRTSTLKLWYMSDRRPCACARASRWYWAVSRLKLSLRVLPRSSLSVSLSPVKTLPSSSATCATSAPRTHTSPTRCGKGAADASADGAPPSSTVASSVRRKTTSCLRSAFHSAATSGRQPASEMVASARTSEGLFSPRCGRPTL